VKKVALAIALLAGTAHADDSGRIAAVQDALRAAKAPLHRCWEKAAAELWQTGGTVKLKVTVGKDGNKVDVVEDLVENQKIAPCAAEVFRGVKVGPAFAVGEAFELPVVFKAVPNVTVRAEDVKARNGAKVLIDKDSADATGASLTVYEGGAHLLGGAEYPIPGTHKLLVVYAPAGPEQAFRDGKVPLGQLKLDASQVEITPVHLIAGQAVKPHAHADRTEIIYIVSGNGTVTVDGEDFPFEGGTAIHVKKGLTHGLTAASAVDLVLFQAKPPPLTVVSRLADAPDVMGAHPLIIDDPRLWLSYADEAPDCFHAEARVKIALDGGKHSLFLTYPKGTEPGKCLEKAPPAPETHVIAGGKGRVDMLLQTPGAYAGRLHLDAGTAVPEHAHDGSSEVLFVLAGTGELIVDGQAYPAAAQSALHIPAGSKHSFKATSDFDAIQFYVPGGPEQRFKGPAKP
jgi:quercetin dioxygenase-like cupin family protein